MSKTPSKRKRLFIASSVSSLPIAQAVHENLDYDLEVTVWTQGVFELTKSALESLTNRVLQKDFDAALFVVTPDDLVLTKGELHHKVRDNVIFELGLFVGALGRANCFLLQPRGQELTLPSDLIGVMPATFESQRSDDNLLAAVGPACSQIKRALAPKSEGASPDSKSISEPEAQRLERAEPATPPTNQDVVLANANAQQVLRTLCRFQSLHHGNNPNARWGFALGHDTDDFPRFAEGVALLRKYGYVFENERMIFLTKVGMGLCPLVPPGDVWDKFP